jgi:hypothetical protein
MKTIKQIFILTTFMLSGTVFASGSAVILECGEYNFIPGGINIKNISSTLVGNPTWLALGAPCSNAIATLLSQGFKIQTQSTSTAQFFAQDNTVFNYTLTKGN